MTQLQDLRFVLTPEHPCSYLADQDARTLFVDPTASMTAPLYQQLSQAGFRRSGSYVYRPACKTCKACIATRVVIADFVPTRRQRRIQRRNTELQVQFATSLKSLELYDLYARYIEARHGDGDMYPPTPEQYESFLLGAWSDTHIVTLSLADRVLAAGVVDVLGDGLSAVYTFYEPADAARSLGVNMVLAEIELARNLGLRYLYLGYWVQDCRKMNYKTDYRPLEMFVQDRWHRLN